jgi:23S rRNA (uridine2552-2'-O)-methyltransferase
MREGSGIFFHFAMTSYNRKDHLYQRAKQEGYRSRAAYKLLELDEKYKLFRPGAKVLDLGSFPGGWLQVACERVGSKGVVVGIDLKDVDPIACHQGCSPTILLGDATTPEMQAQIRELLGKANVVLSDMSAHLTGIALKDAAQSAELVETAFTVATALLKPGGSFVVKAFPSQDLEEVVKRHRQGFGKVGRTVLKSTRVTSNELYLIGTDFRGTEHD